VKTYDRLARFYEPEWSSFSERFAPMLDALIVRHARRQASVLDVACGIGTLALALARRGHTVHGVDRSEAMLERARAASAGVDAVSFSVGDMRELSFDREFDAATCTFDSVNYLTTTDDVLAMMRAVGAALRDGGLYVFDSNTERMYRTHGDGILENEFDGEVFHQEIYYDRRTGQATTVFHFDDGATEVHRQRPYGLSELEPLLTGGGFRVLDAYSGIAFEPYAEDCDRVVVVARKERG
jgi:ubiquinone/menaquinone biosynthesis C-methylase UbiE